MDVHSERTDHRQGQKPPPPIICKFTADTIIGLDVYADVLDSFIDVHLINK